MSLPRLAGEARSGRGHDRWYLGVLLAICLSSGVFVAIQTTTYQAPDERMHVYYVKSLLAGGLPTLTSEKVTMEAHQPPLYYMVLLPSALVSRGLAESDFVLVLRLTSLLLASVPVLAVWRVARRLRPDRSWVAKIAALLIALNPQFIFMSGVVNNDALANALSAVCVMVMVEVYMAGGLARRTVLVAAASMAALLATKVTAWPFALALLVALLIVGWRRQRALALLATVPTVAFLGWWASRNLMTYGTVTMLPYFRELWLVEQHRDFLSPRGVWRWMTTVFDSYWGRFGYFTIVLPRWFYLAVRVGVIVALVGLVRQSIGSWRVWAQPIRRSLAAMAAASLVSLAGIFAWSLNFYQPQGRFLFPALVPVALAIGIGIDSLVPRRFLPFVTVTVAVFFLVADVISLRLIGRLG